MPRYKVIVDDNFHYQDPHERREQGVYETVEEALAVCRGLVDKSLKEEYRSGISAKSLYDRYTSFGDDPSIVVLDGTDDRAIFSAWNYAKERCIVICGEHVERDEA
jgi:hypothetical protein